MKLKDLSFEAWLEHAFGPPMRPGLNAWFFDLDCAWWDPPPAQAITHLTRLFEDPMPALGPYSDDQIAQGLTYLLSISATGHKDWFCAAEVPLDRRLACIAAMETFFAQLFGIRCTAHLSHLSEPEAGDLNRVCYMWWDELPCLALPDDPHRNALNSAALLAMERILALDSVACQESALHGLGHWQSHDPEAVARIVNRYLAANPGRDPRLVTYARSARSGCVL